SDDLLKSFAKDAEHLKLIRELGLNSAMIVPLLVHGQTLGALTFVSAESGRYYDYADLSMAEELGRRAALAVENARLYKRAQSAIQVREDIISIVSHDLKNPLTA